MADDKMKTKPADDVGKPADDVGKPADSPIKGAALGGLAEDKPGAPTIVVNSPRDFTILMRDGKHVEIKAGANTVRADVAGSKALTMYGCTVAGDK